MQATRYVLLKSFKATETPEPVLRQEMHGILIAHRTYFDCLVC
jgi:hypothetical protein